MATPTPSILCYLSSQQRIRIEMKALKTETASRKPSSTPSLRKLTCTSSVRPWLEPAQLRDANVKRDSGYRRSRPHLWFHSYFQGSRTQDYFEKEPSRVSTPTRPSHNPCKHKHVYQLAAAKSRSSMVTVASVKSSSLRILPTAPLLPLTSVPSLHLTINRSMHQYLSPSQVSEPISQMSFIPWAWNLFRLFFSARLGDSQGSPVHASKMVLTCANSYLSKSYIKCVKYLFACYKFGAKHTTYYWQCEVKGIRYWYNVKELRWMHDARYEIKIPGFHLQVICLLLLDRLVPDRSNTFLRLLIVDTISAYWTTVIRP